jgi:hypothetical protein
MGLRSLTRVAVIAASAVALGALPAAAQTATFSTSGQFAIGGSCSMTACNFGGFVLTFTGDASSTAANGSFIDLGTFSLSCPGCDANTVATIDPGSIFTLTINQTSPSVGSPSFSGSVVGTIGYNPTSGGLFWTPTTGSISAGGVTYSLIETDVGGGTLGINISTPTTSLNPNTTSVKGLLNVTTTPEPSTVALMATGLVSLVPIVRRRRRS